MKVDRVCNNNIVQVVGEDGTEYVVMGRGLGFQKKTGDEIDTSLIEKTYVLKNEETLRNLQQVSRNISQEENDIFLNTLLIVERELDTNFEPTFFISLADHLHFAIERHRAGYPLQNPLAWEVRKFYREEYEVGKKIITYINENLSIELDEEEAASVALHIVNAQKDGGQTTKQQALTKLIREILDLVRLHFLIEFDEDSLTYSRFVTHVRYFGQRVLHGKVEGKNDDFLYGQLQNNYPEAFACTQKIANHVESSYEFGMSKDEQVYLTIHIQRVVETVKGK